MPYSGRCGAVKGGFNKECDAKSLILNDLFMHDTDYVTPIIRLATAIQISHRPLDLELIRLLCEVFNNRFCNVSCITFATKLCGPDNIISKRNFNSTLNRKGAVL